MDKYIWDNGYIALYVFQRVGEFNLGLATPPAGFMEFVRHVKFNQMSGEDYKMSAGVQKNVCTLYPDPAPCASNPQLA